MLQVKDIINEYRSSLKNLYNNNEIEQIIRTLFLSYSDFSATDLISKATDSISTSQKEKHQRAIKRLVEGEPLQYITRNAHFHGMELYVNKDVLIPRPETEELVELIIRDMWNQMYVDKKRINIVKLLDIGTGSGCIAIAFKKEFPSAEVWALDKSHRALQVARKNSQMIRVKINFVKADILKTESLTKLPMFDIIVSNPPYIPFEEKSTLATQVRDYEPAQALFVESDPLEFYKAIVNFSKTHLKKNGFLYFETHQNYAKAVSKLLKKNSFTKVKLKKDLSGNDRMVRGQLQ